MLKASDNLSLFFDLASLKNWINVDGLRAGALTSCQLSETSSLSLDVVKEED